MPKNKSVGFVHWILILWQGFIYRGQGQVLCLSTWAKTWITCSPKERFNKILFNVHSPLPLLALQEKFPIAFSWFRLPPRVRVQFITPLAWKHFLEQLCTTFLLLNHQSILHGCMYLYRKLGFMLFISFAEQVRLRELPWFRGSTDRDWMISTKGAPSNKNK